MFGGDWRKISIGFPGLGVIYLNLVGFLAETRLLFLLVATADHVNP